jgi:hypothetical protein
MPVLTGDIEFKIIVKPRGEPLLRDFSCGSNNKYDKGITQNVSRFYGGKETATMLVMTHCGKVAGVSAWEPRPLPSVDGSSFDGVIYVHTIGLSKDFRECWLQDGTRLSSVLLTQTLRQIRSDRAQDGMPGVWAYVGPFNKKAHQLFANHGFATRAPIDKHDVIRFRPPGLDPDLTAGGPTASLSDKPPNRLVDLPPQSVR